MNPWKILGVHRKSSDEDIKDAYYKIAKRYHPDMIRGNMNVFQTANLAYLLIKSKHARSAFLFKIGGSKQCAKCRGTGVSSKSKSLTSKEYTACNGCGGSGFVIKEKNDVAIEL